MSTATPSGLPSQRQVLFWLGLFAVFMLSVWALRDILLPFVAGLAIAYLLDPVADRLEAWGLSRTLSVVIITAMAFLVLALGILVLIPVLQDQVGTFIAKLPDYTRGLWDRLQPLLALAQSHVATEQIETLRANVGEHAGAMLRWLASLLGRVLSGGAAVVSILSLLVITPVVAFYLLRDWDRIVALLDDLLPRQHQDTIRAQAREIDKTLAGFVRGQASVCLILGIFYAVGLSVIGLDVGLIVGFGAGLISFIPYVGSISGFVVSMALALAQFGDITPLLAVAAVFGVGQFVEGNYLTPKLVGESVGLHAVWIIFALMAGGSLFGFVGMLLAVPVAAVIGVLVRFALGEYRDSPLYQGDTPAKPKTTRRRRTPAKRPADAPDKTTEPGT